LLIGTQELYCEIYRRADQPLRRAQSGVTLIAGIPRFAMEALGITLIAVLAYKFSIQPGGLTVAIPVLGAMALSAQRLLPALQQAYHAYATIVATQKSLSDAIELLDQKTDVPHSIDKVKSMDFTRALELVNISFAYVEGEGLIINNLNIKIEKGTRIGIIGTTGSGKSTLMDIIMGLLEPSSGSILVDGTPVQGALVNQWQKNIAHVSQSVYLRDATLAENIAFGVHEVDIDIDRVKFAAKKAHIADYIEGLTYGYNTMVGERGVRFSGGQRQRIAIARALYRSASVLVLDEATSALDEDTESSVIEAIESLDRDLTILIISHKTQTLKKSDRVIKLENGCIVKDGSFIEVVGV
jgi:ABC-type multidrug transport system fused ATPase/permease subunit